MANGWSIIIGFVVIVLASVAGWFLSPKGETQTHYIPRTMAPTYRTPTKWLEDRGGARELRTRYLQYREESK
ncbi:hypothetical protein LOCC1_G003877 [Lachnellula occidentalis]|uniref:Uncharacterized protein n=1 Tax=Lachnellula occidentalis TaxID=215460 RepID=A0A8H8UBV1_9HELO|nr:hypothetical protein LOCC1_G003877 [Lachnellula occidentalis]